MKKKKNFGVGEEKEKKGGKMVVFCNGLTSSESGGLALVLTELARILPR